MSKKLVIFGFGDIAEIAHYYFKTDSDYEVVAFTLDAEYITETEFCGLPVVPFEELTAQYAPNEYELFIALSYARLNEVRKEKFLEATPPHTQLIRELVQCKIEKKEREI